MKKDFSPIVRNSDGHAHLRSVYKYDSQGMPVLKEGPGGEPMQVFSHHEPMDLRRYAVDTLDGRWKGEDSMTPGQAAARIKLRDKIFSALDGIADITADECRILMEALEKRQPAPVVLAMMQQLVDTDYVDKQPKAENS